MAGIEREIARTGLAAHVVAVGAKGCVVFSPEPVRDYRGFLDVDDRYSHAHWLFQHNGGVFLPPWGKIEQWLISVQHDEPDIDLLVANFAAFALGGHPLTGTQVSVMFRPLGAPVAERTLRPMLSQ